MEKKKINGDECNFFSTYVIYKDKWGNILSNFKKIYDHMLRTRKGENED
jgi:hypothetical protein